MPRKLSDKLKSRARVAKRSIEVGNKEMAERMRVHAIALTSGGISKQAIDQARPFARNREASQAIIGVAQVRARPNARKKTRYTASGSFPLNPINKHSGKLQRSLRITPTRNGYRLFFASPYAKYVLRTGGTKFMVDREFWKQMQRYAAYERKRARQRIARDLKRPS